MRRSIYTLAVLASLTSLAGLCACSTTSATIAATAADETAKPADPRERDAAAWLALLEDGGGEIGPGQLERSPGADAPAGAAAQATFLQLASLSVTVQTVGTMARYEVEHVFHNDTDELLEGTFRFPLPHAAIVTGLAMEIEGALMEGEILERERAREIYEEIVDSMRDPALLEWEAGQQFKLRVFPINPGERKRVVMRYMAPLVHDADGQLVAQIPTATPAMQTAIPKLAVSVDGREVLDVADHSARDNLAVPVGAQAHAGLAAYAVERDAEHSYLSARLDLDWDAIPEPARLDLDLDGDVDDPSANRRTVIVVDSSRSALESWDLARESVAALLDGLASDEPFMLVAADLHAQVFAGGFVDNGAERRAAALAFLEAIEPDGASDLSAMLARLEPLLASSGASTNDRVIYLGDGTPTWGTTDREALAREIGGRLGGAPLYALSLGKRESRDTLEALTGATGGRTIRPRSAAQVQAFASFLDRAPSLRSIAEVEVVLPDHARAHAPAATTWFEGEQPVVHFRVGADEAIPREVTIRGRVGQQRVEQTLRLGDPTPLTGVRQQWVARELAETTDKVAAVALSVEHSVLSKHTALLVLESEEAYERYAIERRHGPNAHSRDAEGDPEISGRSLDEAGSPYLGPGDLQPGDPEIHIPAPRDAVSVEILFPFGETKTARWEEALGQWTLRFLVDDDVEAGTYAVLARVTHADGHVELMQLEYTIDMTAPALRLELRARDDGAYDVHAYQVLTEADAARERAEGVRAPDGSEPNPAGTLDASRVELIMPDGQTLSLRRGLEGRFVRRWQPREAVAFPASVTAVVGDRALNNRRVELVLEAPR